MINEENIGKRIRILRKQKHVSQERMAEELGMYQADISNLERAMGGSGISDLFKLDMIADYFEIPLVELLTGFKESSDSNASEDNRSEEDGMKDYVINDVMYGNSEYVYASEVMLCTPDTQTVWVSFSEVDDEPRFYKTKESILISL